MTIFFNKFILQESNISFMGGGGGGGNNPMASLFGQIWVHALLNMFHFLYAYPCWKENKLRPVIKMGRT